MKTKQKQKQSVVEALCDFVNIKKQAQSDEHKERQIKIKKLRKNFRYGAQADGVFEEASMQENTGKTIDQQKITTFTDSTTIHEACDDFSVNEINNTMPTPDLDMFLSRPMVVDVVSWLPTDVIGVSKGVYHFPSAIFTTTFMNKLEKIAFWKPDFEISIRMNGTPMHYGKILFAWIPQGNALNASYTSLYFSGFSNKWIQVSASANQTTTIRVPYMHYKEMINVGATNLDLFTLFTWVSVPLSSVNGTAPPINYTIYSRVVAPNLIGYTPSTNWSTQMAIVGDPKKKKKERVRNKVTAIQGVSGEGEKKTEKGIVSSSITELGSAVSAFSWIPIVGEWADPVGSAIKAAGSLLSWFGLSIPPNLQATQPMQIRQPRLLQFDDLPTTMAMSVLPDPLVVKDYSMVNDDVCAGSLLHFMQRPALVYTGEITSTNAAGTVIYSGYVNPMNFVSYDFLTPYDHTGFVPTPLYFMSKMASLWRGSMRFHLSIICSHFHSIRLRIYYVPYVSGLTSSAPLLTELESTDVINTVLDITEETDYSFTIPYCQQSEWLDTGVVPYSPTNVCSNGAIGIQIINELTSGAAIVSSIYFQLFVSAGADFQLANPISSQMTTLGVYKPQSDFQLLECEIPSSSMECLMTKDYPPLGNVAIGRINQSSYTVTEITGVKQLSNMLCPWISYNSYVVSSTLPSGFLYQPLGDLQFYNSSDSRDFNYFYIMNQVFRYWRGGTRVTARALSGPAAVQMNMGYVDAAGNNIATLLSVPADLNAGTPTHIQFQTNGNAQFDPINLNPFDALIPWYYKYRCSITVCNGTAVGDADYRISPSAAIYLFNEVNYPFLFSTGGGDDVLFGYQIGIPLHTTVPPV